MWALTILAILNLVQDIFGLNFADLFAGLLPAGGGA